MSSDHTIAEHILAYAVRGGADQADVMISRSDSTEVTQRLGKKEAVLRSENTDIGIRVFIGQRQAMISSADDDKKTLEVLTDQAIAMARAVPQDQWCGLQDDYAPIKKTLDLDLYDECLLSAEELLDRASEAEENARAVKGVTNSEGADAFASHGLSLYATSNGFLGQKRGTSSGVSVSVLAGKGEDMQRDYAYTQARHVDDLQAAGAVGQLAGQRAVSRMNPQKIKTQKVPVIYDRRVSTSLLGHLAGGISGGAVARGTTMLKDKMGAAVCAPHITICDDPYLVRGMGSKYYDGEGLVPAKRNIIQDGRLTGWFLDLKSARQLNLPPTGNAKRSASGLPSPGSHNLYMLGGTQSPEEMIAEVKSGFYVTELMGSSVSLLTGDYSRGAAGFWIENGVLTHAVSEVTIAGNLKDMWMAMHPANDLIFERKTEAPTLRLDGMTIAGN